MVRKGLVQMEWNQQKWPLIVSFLFITLFLPLNIYTDYKTWQTYSYTNDPFEVTFDGRMSFYLLVAIAFAVTIGISQIGGERSKGHLEYSFTLPYSRGEMFVSKVVVGVLTLLTGIILSYSLTGMILTFTSANSLFFHAFFIYMTLVVLMTYALILAAGSLTGNVFAQGLTAFSVAVLPVLLAFVLSMNLDLMNERFFHTSHFYFERIMEQVVSYSPIFYIFYGGFAFGPINMDFVNLWVPTIYIFIFFTIGYVAFTKQPYERNGNFFLFEQLNRPVQFLVIIVAILGFSGFVFFSTNHSFIGYLIGAIIGAVIGLFVTRFTIFKKTKQA
ncbi:ABC transporter permease subunit [Bacillus sp. BGMRC 2118]|nr:ABC transporter permease subunit [Bacillus sp. BGMRC 2118]